ncbi:LysR family transcriptional regulator [Serratia odorifera]|jgi:DNA-binding transcriptional LysR family regulator|uniref:LysR substrate binding domain protein n=2 Tax=Serratia odorifera TaxID=618 RepID=D4E267_SEROD|nr:LysR family transcriptional regulator [Serratia odorifera]EFE96002.1 LysR substrate binding domain protein [Serratia odorifera DSM 4582]MBJ2067221.1 LysR family transcriptional regulator [Serratia odorifera]PNK90706.1 LysR family transcriptional regulator [Serratia odorifera]RII71696.1 LysR family transcriptional regulator [Serratia odorifera]VDZ58387.1 D-malate degradation protein R [Serratia odorifera]
MLPTHEYANDLILFALIVECGSFSKAAESAGITSSVISKRIGRLEKSLGARLLYRTTRSLTLTENGQELYRHARTISSQMQEALYAVSERSEALTGTIRMSVPTISGELLLSESVAEFCTQHPDLKVEMRLENRFVDLVNEGIDLAIRTGTMPDSSLIARHILDSRWVIVCSPSYLEHHPQPTTTAELLNHNCLTYTYQESGSANWLVKQPTGDQIAELQVNGNLSANNARAIRKAVIGGYGIAMVPRCMVYEDLQQGKLLEILAGHCGKVLGVYAVYPYTRNLPLKTRLLIEHIICSYKNISHYF